jgi:hypothetical protein
MKKTPQKPSPKKKPYTPPRLTEFGRFTDIVRGTGGNKADGGGRPRSRL